MALWLKQDDGTLAEVSGGVNGEDGQPGTDGIDGLPGADGNMWHVGSGEPSPTLGEVGDYYLDGEDGWVYVKRSNSAWTNLYVNLTGPPGTGGGGGDFLPLTGGTLTGPLQTTGLDARSNGSSSPTNPNITFGTSGVNAQTGFYRNSTGAIQVACEGEPVFRFGKAKANVYNDLQVDGNTLAKINVPADAWGVSNGTVFADQGMVGGTQGSYATAMTSNGYRNTSGGWTSLGMNGKAGATTIELHPNGTFWVRTAATQNTAVSAPPVSFGVIDGLTKAYYDLQVDGQTTGAAGSPAKPTYSFTGGAGSSNMGMYKHANNQIAFSSEGAKVLTLHSSGVYAYAPFRAQNGNVGAPSFSFESDPNTGFYRHAADTPGVSAGGTLVATWDKANGGRFFGPGHATGSAIIGKPGSGYPAYRFYGDEKTGMYRPKPYAIELSGNGVRMMLLAHGANEGEGIGAYIPSILKRATANTANLTVTTDTGNLRYRNARSQFLKKVEDKAETFASPASILELEPMRYKSLHEGDDQNEIHLGFSAEAVAAIDPGLVSYGPVEGCECPPNEEHPDTPCECEQAPLDVRYDRLTVQLLGVVKELRQRIEELENRQ